MTKIDIISGFLGAGKTTLIKKMLSEAYAGEKLVLIENEFGEISIDGGFLKESGVQVSEMSSGCICCSLVGDFGEALKEVYQQFKPDRILIEPSGVGKLSDVIVAVEDTVKDVPEMALNSFVTVADASKVKVYMKNFGEFYNNQIESAGTIILSRTQKLSQEKLEAAVALLRQKNADAAIITTNTLVGEHGLALSGAVIGQGVTCQIQNHGAGHGQRSSQGNIAAQLDFAAGRNSSHQFVRSVDDTVNFLCKDHIRGHHTDDHEHSQCQSQETLEI